MAKLPALDPARLRRAEDRDAQDLFGLLTLCFAAYPGCFTDPHDDLADLRRPGAAFRGEGEAFLVLEDETGRVCACVAVDRPEPGVGELHRLYVRPDRRGRGLARDLVAVAEGIARAAGAARMRLWSDTRFLDAHRLYARLGYAPQGGTRALGDVSNSVEQGFARDL
jgi:putative acetyltransferase